MMIDKFSSSDITCKQPKKDAGDMNVNSAFPLAPSNVTLIIAWEDSELFIILIDICRAEKILFLKPAKNTLSTATFFLINAVSSIVVESILFLHTMSRAMSGSDTLSAMFMKGNMKYFKTFVNYPHIADVVKACNDANSTQKMVIAIWKRFIFSLYDNNGTNVPLLNDIRYISYMKYHFSRSLNTAALPLSAVAAL